jgi:3-oxoacyl-[acyl-carrier-protein] synthase III
MTFPTLYLSKPGITFPEKRYENKNILDEVHSRFNGSPEDWKALSGAIGKVFEKCNTKTRYLDLNPKSRVAEYAVKASNSCLERNRVSVDEIDLVIFAGIAREYFEPATAMEVACKLGLKETHAFDVTTACVGHLEALQVASAYLNMSERYNTALICTAELSREFLCFDIQSASDLYLKAAGLTIGNAAAAMLVRRTPWEDGCIRLISTDTFSLPTHWELCQVPINGQFLSSSTELMRLHKYIAPRLKIVFKKLGWQPNDVDHYVFHQPSEFMTKKILQEVGAETERGIYTHHLYGNNASATVGVVYEELLKQRTVAPGDKLMLGSAASGFTMVTAAGEWHEKT